MEVEKMKCDEISKRNLDISGKKAELVKRLKEAIQNERCLSPSNDSGKPEKASSVDSSKRKSSDESGSEEDHTNKRTKSSDWAQEDESLERSKSEGSQIQNENNSPAITATYYPADDPAYSQSQPSNQDSTQQQQQQQQQSQQYSDSYNQYYANQQSSQQQQQQQHSHPSSSSSSTAAVSSSASTSIEYADPIPNNPVPDEKRKVFVGGLNSSVTEYQIKQVLDSFGAIENIQLIRDNITGLSKGYAFVLFTSEDPATRLINMQSIDICGKSATLRPLTDKNSIKIFVGGISTLTEDDLREYFSQYCNVLEITLIKDQISQKPKGYGFISLSDRKKGEEIINEGKVQIKGVYVNVGNATKRNNNLNNNSMNGYSNIMSGISGVNNYNNSGNSISNSSGISGSVNGMMMSGGYPNSYYSSMYGILPTGAMMMPSSSSTAGSSGAILPGNGSGNGGNSSMYGSAGIMAGYYPYSYSYPYYTYPPVPPVPPVAVPPPPTTAAGTTSTGSSSGNNNSSSSSSNTSNSANSDGYYYGSK